MFPLQASAAAAGVPSGPRVQLLSSGSFLSDFEISSPSGASCLVLWQFDSDGNLKTKQGHAGSLITRYAWLLKGVNSDYDVRLTVNDIDPLGGSMSGGPEDTWLSGDTDRAFSFTSTVPPYGFSHTVLYATLLIRDATTLEVLASRSVQGTLETES